MSVLHQIWADSQLRALNCFSCGVEFAMSDDMYAQRLKDHGSFYCPNGHSQHFTGQTPDQKRIAELERKLLIETSNRESAERSRKWAETAAKGANIQRGKALAAKRRLEHRIACGICPKCHRTFKQLAAHMKSKH